jgi:predicted PurR-regulated permease PerM
VDVSADRAAVRSVSFLQRREVQESRVPRLEDRALLLLVIVVSIAFAWILRPFFSAVLWATVLAIVFAPLYQRLLSSIGQHPNLAALSTVLIIMTLVILPVSLTATVVVQEATDFYEKIQSGELDLGSFFQQLRDALPASVTNLLDRFGLTNLGAVQERISDALKRGSQFLAAQALTVGQGAADFVLGLVVMLYLLFFLLRDGAALSRRIQDAIPLPPEQERELFKKFATVIRATIKGSILVAALQGALGGLIFWALGLHAPVLWGVVMGLLALLPAVGAGLVWVPAAVYLLATGSILQGVVLLVFGALVIGLVDNILRPVLVGKDTKMPDYVVLISTLGGIATLGLNGFIIGPVIAAMFIAAWAIFSDSVTQRER